MADRLVLAVQCYLFGVASLNAALHPSPITVGLLPLFALFCWLAFRRLPA